MEPWIFSNQILNQPLEIFHVEISEEDTWQEYTIVISDPGCTQAYDVMLLCLFYVHTEVSSDQPCLHVWLFVHNHYWVLPWASFPYQSWLHYKEWCAQLFVMQKSQWNQIVIIIVASWLIYHFPVVMHNDTCITIVFSLLSEISYNQRTFSVGILFVTNTLSILFNMFYCLK